MIYLQFDNTHYRRDNADVPSDLEQMPHLLNFLKGNGTLAHERPHDPDLAHRGRHPVVADRPLPGSQRPDGLQLVRLLQADRRRRSSRRRSSTGRTRSTGRTTRCRTWSATVGRRHPAPWLTYTRCRLQRRRRVGREHRAREQLHPAVRRHDARLRRRLARVERGEHTRDEIARAHRLRRHRSSLRARSRAL